MRSRLRGLPRQLQVVLGIGRAPCRQESCDARADAGKHITIVDMYGGFTMNASYKTAHMNDKLHPKDAGYVAMANIWRAAVGNLLPGK